MSKQKELIYQIVLESHNHLTAEEIFFEAKKKIPNIAFGTVYRNLGILLEAQEIRILSFKEGPDHYDNMIMPHDHMRCIKCQKIVDLPKMEMNIPTTYGEILSYEVMAQGICQDCRREDGNG